LTEHRRFVEWLAQQRGLLWIKGKRGAGKSTLLKYALQEATKYPLQNELVVASFFFHGRGAEIQKSSEGLFRSLLCQLLQRVPNILSELHKAFKDKIQAMAESVNWHSKELQNSLTTPLAEVGKSYTFQISID